MYNELSYLFIAYAMQVVWGLGCLGLSRDAYLQRCVREIFTHYLPRYPASITSLLSPTASTNSHHTSTHPHPVLVSLFVDGNDSIKSGMRLKMIFKTVVINSYNTINNLFFPLFSYGLQSHLSVSSFPVAESVSHILMTAQYVCK